MSSSRVFMDADVQPSRDYLGWYAFWYSSEHAVFVILGDAGRELTGKHAS
ncbi:unnamed protein product [Brassica oleracea var. botrytis]